MTINNSMIVNAQRRQPAGRDERRAEGMVRATSVQGKCEQKPIKHTLCLPNWYFPQVAR
jgi:hypothetical protein